MKLVSVIMALFVTGWATAQKPDKQYQVGLYLGNKCWQTALTRTIAARARITHARDRRDTVQWHPFQHSEKTSATRYSHVVQIHRQRYS